MLWTLAVVVPLLVCVLYCILYLKRRYTNHFGTYLEWKTTHSNPRIVPRYLPKQERARMFAKATRDSNWHMDEMMLNTAKSGEHLAHGIGGGLKSMRKSIVALEAGLLLSPRSSTTPREETSRGSARDSARNSAPCSSARGAAHDSMASSATAMESGCSMETAAAPAAAAIKSPRSARGAARSASPWPELRSDPSSPRDQDLTPDPELSPDLPESGGALDVTKLSPRSCAADEAKSSFAATGMPTTQFKGMTTPGRGPGLTVWRPVPAGLPSLAPDSDSSSPAASRVSEAVSEAMLIRSCQLRPVNSANMTESFGSSFGVPEEYSGADVAVEGEERSAAPASSAVPSSAVPSSLVPPLRLTTPAGVPAIAPVRLPMAARLPVPPLRLTTPAGAPAIAPVRLPMAARLPMPGLPMPGLPEGAPGLPEGAPAIAPLRLGHAPGAAPASSEPSSNPSSNPSMGSARRMSRAREANRQRRLCEMSEGTAASIMAESAATPGRGSVGPVFTRV